MMLILQWKRTALVLAALHAIVTSQGFAHAFLGSDVTPEDVTIYIKDPKTGAVAGAPVGKLMLLGELTSIPFINKDGISGLEAASQEILITNLGQVKSNSCQVPNQEADFLITTEGSQGRRRLHQCVPWFSKCGRGSSAAFVTPVMSDGVVGQEPEPFLPNLPSAGPGTSPPSLFETVSVSICLKTICYTFEVQSEEFIRSILEAGEYLCPDMF